MYRLAGAAILLAAAPPAHATQWYFVDAAGDNSNISFIDKDSIRAGAEGHLLASMYSVLAEPEDGASAYRFQVEFDCSAKRSRLLTGELFDEAQQSDGVADIAGEWSTTEDGSQGATISAFVCSRGEGAEAKNAVGSELPFAKGRSMLAAFRAKDS